MASGLSEDVLFFKFKSEAKEAEADLDVKCFTHRMKSFPWIPFESRARLKVARKFWDASRVIRVKHACLRL